MSASASAGPVLEDREDVVDVSMDLQVDGQWSFWLSTAVVG
jgi:hypothetical protein